MCFYGSSMKMIIYYGLYCHQISTQLMTYQRMWTNVLDSPLFWWHSTLFCGFFMILICI